MRNTRINAANAFYLLAIVLSSLGFMLNVAIHWRYLVAGKGLGSFSVIWTELYIAITLVLWLLAFLLNRDKWRTIIYWGVVVASLALYAIFPVVFI